MGRDVVRGAQSSSRMCVCACVCDFVCVCMLGAICGSARSMDLAAQPMDPYFAQESMDRAR